METNYIFTYNYTNTTNSHTINYKESADDLNYLLEAGVKFTEFHPIGRGEMIDGNTGEIICFIQNGQIIGLH